jgi:cell division septal protein FtsQ
MNIERKKSKTVFEKKKKNTTKKKKRKHSFCFCFFFLHFLFFFLHMQNVVFLKLKKKNEQGGKKKTSKIATQTDLKEKSFKSTHTFEAIQIARVFVLLNKTFFFCFCLFYSVRVFFLQTFFSLNRKSHVSNIMHNAKKEK